VDTRPCPCGSLEAFDACCGRYLGPDGVAPPTAEALMRSRYTAFVRGDVEHLLRTWHPKTRPRTLQLDPGVRWTGLDVVDRVGGTGPSCLGGHSRPVNHRTCGPWDLGRDLPGKSAGHDRSVVGPLIAGDPRED
jgi:uncharacterized protein YchJ